MGIHYHNILVTGGAGFVGSNVALCFKKKYPNTRVSVLDNLKRRGSELNIQRLQSKGIRFYHGDIRNTEDLTIFNSGELDLIIECSAEPSVLAGYTNPDFMLQTNLLGTINCLELARKHKSHFVFLSTSRIYPIELINSLSFSETNTRFVINTNQTIRGASEKGISENFPIMEGTRSIYGSSKLASELILQEYVESFDIKAIINRCGILTGPWQMGKVDQGVAVLWMANHIFKRPLSYIGYHGSGKQVRDFLHVSDLFTIIDIQLQDIDTFNGIPFNVGGGLENSFSLLELTKICQEISGNITTITKEEKDRKGDLKVYISNCDTIKKLTTWKPQKDLTETMKDIHAWILDNRHLLLNILQ